MQIADVTVLKLLEQGGKTSPEQLTALQEEAERSKRPAQVLAIERNLISEIDLTKAYAEETGTPYVELKPNDIPNEVLAKIPEKIARQYNAVLFQIDEDGTMHLAMDDPDDVQAVNFIQKQIGTNVKLYVAAHDNILNCLENYAGDVGEKLSDAIDIQSENDGSNQTVTDADIAEDSPLAKTINLLLEYAIRSSASDIHIEPREDYSQIRYRIHCVLN